MSSPQTQPRYDVFLSHHSSDKPHVETLATRLEDEAKLKPFLDKWHLVPGAPWQEELEAALDQSATCAVFLGASGLGAWENEEMRSALDERVRNPNFRVIPVLLPGAQPKDERTLPRFLRRLTWVDFRAGLDDSVAFHRLVAGIKGVAPGRLAGQPNSNSAEEAQTAETKPGQNPDVLVTNTKSPDQEPVVRAAHITSRRALIGVMITAVLAAIATISAATINKCDGVIKLSPSPTPAPFIGRISDKNT